MIEGPRDNRQILHYEKYRSEVLTLALTSSGFTLNSFGQRTTELGTGFLCLSAKSRIRVRKEDLRLPMTCFVAFEPDGGDPTKASINAFSTLREDVGGLRVAIAELMLVRRSYVPILRLVGSSIEAGLVTVPNRPGALGYAFRVSDECDCVDIEAELPYACGDQTFNTAERPGEPPRLVNWSGRWVFGYSFTTNERLGREEWSDAASKTNVMIETTANTTDGVSVPVNGIPTIVKALGG